MFNCYGTLAIKNGRLIGVLRGFATFPEIWSFTLTVSSGCPSKTPDAPATNPETAGMHFDHNEWCWEEDGIEDDDDGTGTNASSLLDTEFIDLLKMSYQMH